MFTYSLCFGGTDLQGVVIMDKVYKTAVYLRISRDDENEKESGSISNQRQILMAFLENREDLKFFKEFVDDGFSGYDFNRPAFQKMLECVKNHEIDCIVVKDFSRLGRNFQKTEEYMQRIFPKLGVRFISVSDCYDSNREQSASERLANPIINLMNEYHVMETSQKVRNVLEHYRRNGKFIGNHTVYGYVIKDKHLEVDPYAAEIVRKIFNLKIEGISNQAIGEYLNEMGIDSPLEYKINNGLSVTGKHLRVGEKALWSSVNVRRILENPIYIGTLIQGKTTSLSYRDKRRFKKDPSEMSVVENEHEAIISDTVFLIVQDLLQKDSYSKKNLNKSYMFSGFAYCGNCGKVLYYRQDSGKDTYCQCRNTQCQHKGTIKEKILAKAVFETLKKHMEVILNHSEPVVKSDFLNDLKMTDMKLSELEKQISQLNQSKSNLLNQKEQGMISEKDYAEMCDFYDNKIAKSEFESDEIQHQKTRLLNSIDDIKNQYRKYSDFTELTRGIVVTFIEKIEVFSKTKIRIYFRYENLFKTDGDSSGT